MEYSFFMGRRGEEGLGEVVRMIRFDQTIEVFMVVVEMNDDGTFNTIDELGCVKATYHLTRKVHLGNGISADVYYSEDTDISYVNIAQAAPAFRKRTSSFIGQQFENNYKGYFYIAHVGGKNRVVKVLTE
ncbi:hypothetical protein SEPL_315 [Salmonella phage SE_PL]|uniref:hypothetical protein n=1 Tax=Salmonella enterica TaxID=28901 RepID=UPI000FDF8934|nr:hypothetical protein CPT_Munch_109 [Salmonella phage Munch]EAZ2022903.1 hypothetical protein [Salmonella enterica]ECV9084037.1 hypothetical protein [Salmonella enterica subsp. enterica serovar Infantis]MCP0435861.1 hypothetical protein [Salmonella enterica subsp. enterica serovar Mbandaka]QCW18788.1 hypothetical protein 7t3_0267 [Salmonella phage 7t3]QIG62928.1 hypothetical protein SEPL_315 [Salmonella phage SE_PL]WNV47216.1 hypothetical protein [Klebsiella phage fENko-Kae01]